MFLLAGAIVLNKIIEVYFGISVSVAALPI